MSSFLTRTLRASSSISRSSGVSTRAIASSLVVRAEPQDAGYRENSKNPDPQRSRQGDEEGIKTDDVASTDAAFESGSSDPATASKKIENETGDTMQSTPADPTASHPKGAVSNATDDAKP